jgi:hypothetical protein
MPDTLTLNVRASLDWLFKETLDLSIVSDVSRLEFSSAAVDGTGADQCDKLWHDERTVAGGANDDLDLSALAMSLFGSSVTISLEKLKWLVLVNKSTTSGDKLRLDSSATNGFTGLFGDSATSKFEIGADSPLLVGRKRDGWTVDATHKVLRIHNPGGTAITYRIALAGTSV